MDRSSLRRIVVLAALSACAPSQHEVHLVPMPGNPAPAYPQTLRDSAFPGTVEVRMQVDGSGAVIPSSLQVVNETNPAFTAEVRRVVPSWRFQRDRGDSSVAVVQQRFHFKIRQPTAAECRALLAQENAIDTSRAQQLRVLRSRPPSRGGNVQTLAEFVVDTTGRPDVSTLRIVQSSIPDRDARSELERVLDDWRFAPASKGGCVYASKAQYQFVY